MAMKEGHIVVTLCLIFYCLSYYFYREKKYPIGIYFLLGAVVIIRVYIGSHQYFFPWDERYHALVAKNMIDNPFKPMLIKDPVLQYNISDWSLNHIWLHKPPLTLWLIALSYKIFGLNVFALRFPSLVMSVFTVYFIYKIGEKLFSAKTGWWSAITFSIIAFPITIATGMGSTDHVDMTFMFTITAAIYAGILAVQKKKWGWYILSGFALGCAILTKWLPALIVLPVIGAYMLHQREAGLKKSTVGMLLIIAIAFLVAAPWQFYIFNAFHAEAKYEQEYNALHIFQSLEGHQGSPWFHVDAIVWFWSFMFYVIFPLYLFFIWKDQLKWKGITITLWILIPIIFFSFVQTKMYAYCLFTYPAIAIAFGYTFNRLSEVTGKWRLITLLPAFIFFPLVSLFTIDHMGMNKERINDYDWNKQIKLLGKESRAKPLVVFNSPHYIELMFYMDNCTAYHYETDSLTIADVKSRGYDVFTYNPDLDTYKHE